jgi:hypothetical protein
MPETGRMLDNASIAVGMREASMNQEFLRERARRVREIAETTDPFKQRLLDLALRYDAPLRLPRATPIGWPKAIASQAKLDGER